MSETMPIMDLTPVEELYEVHLTPIGAEEVYVFKVDEMVIDKVNCHTLFTFKAPYSEKDLDYFGQHPSFSKMQVFSSDLNTVYKTEVSNMKATIARGDLHPHNFAKLMVMLCTNEEDDEVVPNEEEQENGVS